MDTGQKVIHKKCCCVVDKRMAFLEKPQLKNQTLIRNKQMKLMSYPKMWLKTV